MFILLNRFHHVFQFRLGIYYLHFDLRALQTQTQFVSYKLHYTPTFQTISPSIYEFPIVDEKDYQLKAAMLSQCLSLNQGAF